MYDRRHGSDSIHLHRKMREREEQERLKRKKENAAEKSSSTGNLSVSEPDDVSEKEADAIAKKVVSGQSAEIPNGSGTGASIQTKSNGENSANASELQTQLSSSKGGGQSLDDVTRSEMETKMGTDFSEVKIHTDSNADAMSESVNAKAFAHGQDVYFRNGNYNPSSSEGKELLAHELVHTKQGEENILSRSIGDEFGQTAQGSSRYMVCDLTSPIRIGSEPKYDIRKKTDIVYSTGVKIQYEWFFYNENTHLLSAYEKTDEPSYQYSVDSSGKYKITCNVLFDGKKVDTMVMSQEMKAEDAGLDELINKNVQLLSPSALTYREVINDLHDYIINSANETGENGITPLTLVSVLCVEIENRPKTSDRKTEIAEVEGYFNTIKTGGTLWPWQNVNESIGVGQIRLSTAAMLNGQTAWIEQDSENRSEARDTINANFEKLGLNQQYSIFEQVKYPKSNITMAAQLLNKIKNRTNRYPTANRTDFAKNERAVGIVATEYNQGSTNSAEKDTVPSEYGKSVWRNMNDNVLIKYFPNI